MAKAELGFECQNLKSQMVSNTRIQIMLRTVLTFGQPRNAKGERTKEDVTDNGSKKIVKWPVKFVKLSYNEWPVNEHELDWNKLVEITVLQFFSIKSWQAEISFAFS